MIGRKTIGLVIGGIPALIFLGTTVWLAVANGVWWYLIWLVLLAVCFAGFWRLISLNSRL